MRILFLSQSDGVWFIHKLIGEGHQVDWVSDEDKYSGVLAGIIPPPTEHPDDPSAYDLIVFDAAGAGEIADGLREHSPVIGSSALAERLEKDRLFGIEFMEQCGIPVPPYETFSSVDDAKKWLADSKKRTVLKPIGDIEDKATTYVSKSSEDMISYLDVLSKRIKKHDFLLQEFVPGTEISTEGWFNGQDFHAINHTLEEKKFLAGGIGPNTGCAGNLVWMPPRGNPLFERGLSRTGDALRGAGFVGPIDLNTIVTEGQLYGLEWTPRFGYEGTCNLTRLISGQFGEFLHTIATGGAPPAPTHARFAATVRATIPPYPNPSRASKYEGTPIHGLPDNLDTFYVLDIRKNEEGEFESCGTCGLIGSPIGIGDTPEAAFKECTTAIERLQIPDLQYRNDIEKCCMKRYLKLREDGWLRSI